MSAVYNLQDQLLAHQISLQQYAEELRVRVLVELNRSDEPLAQSLRRELERFGELNAQQRATQLRRSTRRWMNITSTRDVAWQAAQKVLQDEVCQFAQAEAEFTHAALRGVLPEELSVIPVSGNEVLAAAEARPFQGRTLSDWLQGVAEADRQRIHNSITQGLIEEHSIDEMLVRVRGTPAAGYKDGLLELARRDVDTITRTAVNHISSFARDVVFAANPDIVLGMKWVATLDSRTSSQCRGRDGAITPLPDRERDLPKDARLLSPSTARPPAHFNCRSMLTAVFDVKRISDQLSDIITVRDPQTGQPISINFREQAQTAWQTTHGPRTWSRLPSTTQRRLIQAERNAWTTRNIGTVPSDIAFRE